MSEKYYDDFLEKMKQKYCSLAGSVPNDASDVGIRMKVLAQELANLWDRLDYAKQQLFPITAEGDYLDLHAQNRGITRKNGSWAKGEVTFSRENYATAQIPIPKGTVVSTGGVDAVRFVTTSDAVMQKDDKSVNAKVQCQQVGAIGNIAIGAIKVMVTPISGISYVTNADVFTSGTDVESDERLRKRLFEDYKKVSNGTNTEFYYNKVMEHEGITSANVIPRVNGIGTVGVIVDSLNTDVSEELVSEIKEELNLIKEINVDVDVSAAQVKQVPVEIEIIVSNGFTYDSAREACYLAIENLFSNLGVAKPLFISQIIGSIAQLDEVENCRVIEPSADTRPTGQQILRLKQIIIGKMSVI